MDLIERLRPRWRHPDPEIRAAAVREMGRDDRERLAAIARDDPDARVRRAAIKRLDDPEALARVAANDPDAALRALAAERSEQVLEAVAASEGPLAACEAALARLTDERLLAGLASTARHAAIRRAALARLAGDRLLRDVVRQTADPAIRHAALARIGDQAVLRAIAVGEGPEDTALAALDRIDDGAALRAIADNRGAPARVRQRARERVAVLSGDGPALDAKAARGRQVELCALVHSLRAEADVVAAAGRVREAEREWRALVARAEPHPEVAERFAAACAAISSDAESLLRRRAAAERATAALERDLETRAALCERVEAADDADAARVLADARAAWDALGAIPDARGEVLARRFAAAATACAERHRAWTAREAAHRALAALVDEAEALAEAVPPPATGAWRALERRRDALALDVVPADQAAALRRRLERAGERLRARREEAVRDARARLEAACARAEEMAAAATLKPGAARRQLEALEAAQRDAGPLAAAGRRDWTARLEEARAGLLRRLGEVEETEEWRRWANTAAQEEIIARIEGWLAAGELAEGWRQLGGLQEEWDRVATATRDKSQALWERFRAARTRLRARCAAWMAENLERKTALCERVAPLGDSTDWNATAELIRHLQAEWKAIGPVPPAHAAALWQRFREPCDTFFARRKAHFDRLDGERRRHAEQKTALCEQAEALADSTDWEVAAAAIKRLQVEWKQTGVPRRAEAEALWQRFRAACDRFFERYRRRDELARDQARAQAVAIAERFETLAAAVEGGAAGDTGQELERAWSEWLRLDPGVRAAAGDAGRRLHAACERIVAAAPECLRGTRLDPEATRPAREKLCRRLDELLGGLEAPAHQPSLREMALALRERLASNTIGGSGGDDPRRREAARELDRVAAAWSRLGPALGGDARALATRFEDVCARVRAALGGRSASSGISK